MSEEDKTEEVEDAQTTEILEAPVTNQSGNDRVEVLMFDVVVSPGSSVSVFYQVVVNNAKSTLRELTVSFVKTQNGVVQNTIASASVESPGQGTHGALDVLPAAFDAVEGDGAGCILSGWVDDQNFFFRKTVDLE